MSDFELREACRFSVRSWEQWLELDGGERAYSVAHYRLHNALEANVGDAHSEYMDRQSRRASRRSGNKR